MTDFTPSVDFRRLIELKKLPARCPKCKRLGTLSPRGDTTKWYDVTKPLAWECKICGLKNEACVELEGENLGFLEGEQAEAQATVDAYAEKIAGLKGSAPSPMEVPSTSKKGGEKPKETWSRNQQELGKHLADEFDRLTPSQKKRGHWRDNIHYIKVKCLDYINARTGEPFNPETLYSSYQQKFEPGKRKRIKVVPMSRAPLT